MKKSLFATSVIVLALLASACKKEGIYKPVKQISSKYEYSERSSQRYDATTKMWRTISVDSVPRHRTEGWNWSDGKLQKIDYYESGVIDHSIAFVYDGNRMIRINNGEDGSHTECVYDGKYLSEMQFYNKQGKPLRTMTFSHDGKEITKITISSGSKGSDYGVSASEQFVLRTLTGNTLCEKALSSESAKGNDNVELTLTWNKGNIKTIAYSKPEMTVTYTHDNKSNPLGGLFSSLVSGASAHDQFTFGNKNNITSSSISYSNGNSEKQNYSYTYSEDLPTSVSQSIIDNYTTGYRYVYTYITMLEYNE